MSWTARTEKTLKKISGNWKWLGIKENNATSEKDFFLLFVGYLWDVKGTCTCIIFGALKNNENNSSFDTMTQGHPEMKLICLDFSKQT